MSAKAYYEANKEAILARIRAWQIANPDKRKATKAKWYNNHRDAEKQKQDRYRKENAAKYLFTRARRRALAAGIPFDIELSDVVVPQICPLLEMPINSYSEKPGFRPSLDRIRPDLGYVKGNVQVVSHRANRLKNNANGTELMLLAINTLRAEGELP